MTAEDFDEEFLQQLREAFAIEANEHLQSMTNGLLELEQAPEPARRMEIVVTIFRDAHSLKGAAGAITRGDIESVSRALEGIFALWKTSAVTAPPETFDLIKRAVTLLDNLLQASGSSINPADQMKVTQIVHELTLATSAASAPGS
jgi:two-component system chemotaxis sensor kinase CheA